MARKSLGKARKGNHKTGKVHRKRGKTRRRSGKVRRRSRRNRCGGLTGMGSGTESDSHRGLGLNMSRRAKALIEENKARMHHVHNKSKLWEF